MLIDDLREQLKSVEADIDALKHFWKTSNLEETLKKLTDQIHQEDFWQHPQRDQILSQHHGLKEQADQYHELTKAYADNIEIIELFA